jgi:hypothetical protein
MRRVLRMSIPDFPELLRTTHHLGTPLPDPRHQAIHDAWFGPLLKARAAAHRERDTARQIACFAASRLMAAYLEVIADLARKAHPAEGAAMRALEARIEEATEPVFTALRRLTQEEREMMPMPTSTASATWPAWLASLRAVVAAVDETFIDVVRTVTDKARHD